MKPATPLKTPTPVISPALERDLIFTHMTGYLPANRSVPRLQDLRRYVVLSEATKRWTVKEDSLLARLERLEFYRAAAWCIAEGFVVAPDPSVNQAVAGGALGSAVIFFLHPEGKRRARVLCDGLIEITEATAYRLAGIHPGAPAIPVS